MKIALFTTVWKRFRDHSVTLASRQSECRRWSTRYETRAKSALCRRNNTKSCFIKEALASTSRQPQQFRRKRSSWRDQDSWRKKKSRARPKQRQSLRDSQ